MEDVEIRIKEETISWDPLNSIDNLEIVKNEEYLDNDLQEVSGEIVLNKLESQQPAQKSQPEVKVSYVYLDKAYQCKVCSFRAPLIANIKKHLWVEHKVSAVNEAPYEGEAKDPLLKSEDCPYVFSNTGYRCKLCDYEHREHSKMVLHVSKSHLDVKQYKCELCIATFYSLEEFESHKFFHAIEKPYRCTMCGHSSSEPLDEHMKLHDPEQSYDCSLCEYKTNIYRYFTSHIRIHAKEDSHNTTLPKDGLYVYRNQRFECKLCEYTCLKHDRISSHVIRNHIRVKNYQCEMCGKTFVSAPDLKLHYRVHTGEKPYKCSECDYESTNTISQHRKLHAGHKPYQCYNCDYRASHKYRLARHMKIHTGVKPFKCVICKYQTAHKISLKKHMSKHEDVSKS